MRLLCVIVWLCLSLMFMGCGDNAKPKIVCGKLTVSQCLTPAIVADCSEEVDNQEKQCTDTLIAHDNFNCSDLSPSECLDAAVETYCADKVEDFEGTCNDVLLAQAQGAKTEFTLVPEMTGFESTADNTVRARSDVIYKDQPFLFIPLETIPSSYFIHMAQFGLLSTNDMLANDGLHSDDFTTLELDPSLVLPRKSKAKAVMDYAVLPQPVMAVSPEYMFQDLGYTIDMLSSYFDSLYTGKVGEWNENGVAVESCEEYTYEKLYDLSLFKDFLALHQDDPVRVVEYAYRGTTPDLEGGWPSYDLSDIQPGAIGTRGLSAYYDLSNYFPGENVEKTLMRKGGYEKTVDPPSVFSEPNLHYAPNSYMEFESEFVTEPTREISYSSYYDNELTPNKPELVGTRWVSPAKLPHPKNFFLEVMEGIKGNESQSEGVVLTDPELISVYEQSDYDLSQVCYTDSFYFHFYMLQAAKRIYPNSTTLKLKLREFQMLRRHLIELLAERSRYESALTIISDTESEGILRHATTLPRSEKAFAVQRLDEYASGHNTGAMAKDTKALPFIDIIDGPQLVNVFAELDGQIQAVLLEAKEKGCLETDMHSTDTNYLTEYDPDGVPSNVSDGTMMLFEPKLNYNKALCDWTPEMFSVAAEKLLPDDVFEQVYDECKRITCNDFENANIDHYQFRFPSACQDNVKFAAWKPNTYYDYTENTIAFREFESLVKAYPSALLDCDNVIQKATLDDLKEADMSYFDPVSGAIMMSKSLSNYHDIGGTYAGLNFGYALGWLYEGYEDVDSISDNDINRGTLSAEVCTNTNFFAFGNYFASGSFLKHDFTLCSAGSYASNKTDGGGRPVPPTLADSRLSTHINSEIKAVAQENNVTTNYFMFIKNEKMTFSYNNNGYTEQPVTVTHSEPFVQNSVNYQNTAATGDQMIKVEMQQSVPICGIISITIRGKVSGDIDADSIVTGDKLGYFNSGHTCKSMDFNFTPFLDFDGFASASVTAGISGVASISAGVDLNLKFAHVAFPYTANLSLSDYNGPDVDIDFNYDIWVKANNSLEQQITLLAGSFGAFVKLEYLVGSDTYHQKLFSWDGIKFNGTIDSLASPETPFHAPIRALNGLANLRN